VGAFELRKQVRRGGAEGGKKSEDVDFRTDVYKKNSIA
jgi:hypothetical protein